MYCLFVECLCRVFMSSVYVCTFDARQHVVFINKLFEFEYCCEMWGLESALKCKEADPYELLHTKYMKEILGVHFKTPNAACRSELARQPCRTKIITACIKYLDHSHFF